MGGVELTVDPSGVNVVDGDVRVCADILVPALSMRDFRRRVAGYGCTLGHEDMLRVAEAVAAWIKLMLSHNYSIWQILCIERPEGRRANGARI